MTLYPEKVTFEEFLSFVTIRSCGLPRLHWIWTSGKSGRSHSVIFFYFFKTLLQSQLIKCHCSHVVCDFSCLGKDKKWNRFKVLKIQLRISFSFVGIEIGRIRLQFCEDIHFYRKLKIEVGLEGPIVFKNEQSNPSFDASFLNAVFL